MSSLRYSDDHCELYGGEALAMLAELPSGSVDAVVADPPYSSNGMVRNDRTMSTGQKYHEGAQVEFGGDNRDQRAYSYWSALWMAEAMRATSGGGLIMVFTDWRQLPATTDAIQAGGWVWRGVVPWVKPNARPFQGRFTNQCEYVVWGSNGSMGHNVEASVFPGFYEAHPPRSREHMTQKPLDVMRQLVKICPEGGTVLDPFMGSGTTGVAAIVEGRRFIGCEKVDHYAEIAERRIREARGEGMDRGSQRALALG